MLILLDFVSNFKNTLDIGDIIIDVILIVGDDVMVDNGSNDEQQLFFSLSRSFLVLLLLSILLYRLALRLCTAREGEREST